MVHYKDLFSKTLVICFCGLGFILKGMSLETVHRKNIELAIHRFGELLTNANESASHDFFAILWEINGVKSDVVRTNLLSKLADVLCVASKDIWKYKNSERFQWKRVFLMEMVKEGLGRYPKWYRVEPTEKK